MASDEQRFAMGLGAVVAVIALVVLLLNWIDIGGDTAGDPAKAEPIAPTVSTPSDSQRPTSSDTDRVAVVSEADAVGGDAVGTTGQDVDTAGSDEGDRSDAAMDADDAAAMPLVIDPVPLAYFRPDSNTLNLPPVIEKYIERVDRGTRFMARLEHIVADAAPEKSGSSAAPIDLTFTLQSVSKRLSYNAVDTTQWLEAGFAAKHAPNTNDVLVDVRRGESIAEPGVRMSLFFASVQPRDGVPSFALDLSDIDAPVVLTLYALDDALTPLGAAALDPDTVSR